MQLQEIQSLKSKESNTGNRMKCHRSESIMIYEKFYGLDEQFWGWRCIWCGEIVDSLILKNRGPAATGHCGDKPGPTCKGRSEELGRITP